MINDKDSAYYNYLDKSCCADDENRDESRCALCCKRFCSSSYQKIQKIFFKRSKRLIFLLLFPSMIYFECILLLSDAEWKELLKTIGEDKLLFGFPTMLGSLENRQFLPPEGPMGALVCYFISGFLVMFLVEDFENSVLGRGIDVPLTNTVNMLAPKGFKNLPKRGYYNTGQILKVGMYLPLNAVYWITGKGCVMKLCRLILLPFFAIPIIPFSCIALCGWKRYLEDIKSEDISSCCSCCCTDMIFKIFKKIAVPISIVIF